MLLFWDEWQEADAATKMKLVMLVKVQLLRARLMMRKRLKRMGVEPSNVWSKGINA